MKTSVITGQSISFDFKNIIMLILNNKDKNMTPHIMIAKISCL